MRCATRHSGELRRGTTAYLISEAYSPVVLMVRVSSATDLCHGMPHTHRLMGAEA